jgi:hypothetical protein
MHKSLQEENENSNLNLPSTTPPLPPSSKNTKPSGILFFPSVNWTNNYFLEKFTKYFFPKKLRRTHLETTWVNFDLESPFHLRHGLPQSKFGCSSNPALKEASLMVIKI